MVKQFSGYWLSPGKVSESRSSCSRVTIPVDCVWMFCLFTACSLSIRCLAQFSCFWTLCCNSLSRFLFPKTSFPTFLLSLFGMSLYVICVVLLKGSFRSLQVTCFSPFFFFFSSSPIVCFFLLPCGLHMCVSNTWQGFALLARCQCAAVVVSSQAGSRMSMSRLWMNQH